MILARHFSAGEEMHEWSPVGTIEFIPKHPILNIVFLENGRLPSVVPTGLICLFSLVPGLKCRDHSVPNGTKTCNWHG
jgi:hypothetical protein